MEIEIRFEEPSIDESPIVIVPILEGEELTGPQARLDELLGGTISERLEAGDIQGRAKEIQVLFPDHHSSPARVLTLGSSSSRRANQSGPSVKLPARAASRLPPNTALQLTGHSAVQ